MHVYNHILTFTKLAAHSASVVKSNFGNFGSINPISTSGTAHSLIMHLKSTSDHSFYDYCCTMSCCYTTRTPCAVERDVRCVPLVRGSIQAAARVRRVCLRKSNYVKIIPTYMMIREIILGRQRGFDGVLYKM